MNITNLDLDTLRTLVVAVELGSYSQAGQRLGRTPSAVSLQMKRLQEEANAQLFRKDGRNLALTEIGEIVLHYARRMLQLNDEALDRARGASMGGAVRLGCIEDFAEILLPEVLSRFTELYPLVQIEVRIDRNMALADAVEAGQLDLALTLGQAERRTAEVLGEVPMTWIACRRFRWQRGLTLPLVMFDTACPLRMRALQALDHAGIEWRLALTSPSLAGLWAGATAGLGVTVRSRLGLPSHLLAEPDLFSLPVLGHFAVVLHRRGDTRSKAVDRFSEIVGHAVRDSLSDGGRGSLDSFGLRREILPLADSAGPGGASFQSALVY